MDDRCRGVDKENWKPHKKESAKKNEEKKEREARQIREGIKCNLLNVLFCGMCFFLHVLFQAICFPSGIPCFVWTMYFSSPVFYLEDVFH